MKLIDLNSFSNHLDTITLAAFRAQYKKFSAEYGPRCSAAEYDKRVISLSNAEKTVAWASEVKNLVREYEQKNDVLRFAANTPLIEELTVAADGILADAASAMDRKISATLSEARSFARCDHIKELYAVFNDTDENIKALCKEANDLKAAYKKLDNELFLLTKEKEINSLAMEKAETVSWCERVESMYSQPRDKLAKCENYDLLEQLAKDAAFMRLKFECAEYSVALQKELPYEKIFELDEKIPQHASALSEVIPSFREKWANCLATAHKRASAQAQQWYQEALTSPQREMAVLFKKAADLGHTLACYRAGLCYLEGTGIEKRDDLAFLYFQKAATGGVHEANYYLGLSYLYGHGCKRDDCLAFRMFETCINSQTDPEIACLSLYRLGVCYYDGCGVEKDKTKAFTLFQTAANKGSSDSMYRLGVCYEKGDGVTVSEKDALSWYDKAAKLGVREAADAATHLRAVQKKRKEKEEAARLARICADAASAMDRKISATLSEARSFARCDHIKELYAEFNDTDKNVKALCKEANDLKAAYKKLDNDILILNTEKEIDSLAKQKERSAAWCEQVLNMSSKSDILSKCANYAKFSELPQIATATLKKIQEEKAKARDREIDTCYALAKKGNADAQFQLAECYFSGNGVTRSYQEAFFWFQKAAKGGNKQAMARVGDCYYHGYGVEQSYSKAEKWYNKAMK